jgi:hypothetical protein
MDLGVLQACIRAWRTQWSIDYLPLVQRIMNAKVHDTIGNSPAELLFGQAINLYSGLLSAIPPESLIRGLDDSASGRLSEHVAKLTKAQHCAGSRAKSR